MIAILKIRFCVLKRHYIKTFFICFLPSILIFLFSLAGKKLIDDVDSKEGISHYNQKNLYLCNIKVRENINVTNLI